MSSRFPPAVLLLAGILASCASSQQPTGEPPQSRESAAFETRQYRLSAGDKVDITVFQEPDLSGVYQVESTGHINYPFVGRLPAAGETVAELENRIKRGLSAGYLVDPDVRAFVTSYQPVFVGGEVNNPGEYPFNPGLTVQQAITLAGGVTRFAAEKYYVQRRDASIDERFRATASSPIYPGDTITVEERLF